MPPIVLLILIGVVVWGFSDGAAAQTRVETRRIREVIREHVRTEVNRRIEEGRRNPKSAWGIAAALLTGGQAIRRALRGARPGARSPQAQSLPSNSPWRRILAAGFAGGRSAARRGRDEARRRREEWKAKPRRGRGAPWAGWWGHTWRSARPYPGPTGVCDDCQRSCDARALRPDPARPGWVVCAGCMTPQPARPAEPEPGPAIGTAPPALPGAGDPEPAPTPTSPPTSPPASPPAPVPPLAPATGGTPYDGGGRGRRDAERAQRLATGQPAAIVTPGGNPEPPPAGGGPTHIPTPLQEGQALPQVTPASTTNEPPEGAGTDMAAGNGGALMPRGGGPAARNTGEVNHHGDFQQGVTDLVVLSMALAGALEGMLGNLTSVNAGRDQFSGVTHFHDRSAGFVKLLGTMLSAVDSQQMPVVEAVTAAGGPSQVNDMPYYQEA